MVKSVSEKSSVDQSPIRSREIGGVSLSDLLYVLEGRDSKSYALLVGLDLTAHRLK